jgi:hypothetical protein
MTVLNFYVFKVLTETKRVFFISSFSSKIFSDILLRVDYSVYWVHFLFSKWTCITSFQTFWDYTDTVTLIAAVNMLPSHFPSKLPFGKAHQVFHDLNASIIYLRVLLGHFIYYTQFCSVFLLLQNKTIQNLPFLCGIKNQ